MGRKRVRGGKGKEERVDIAWPDLWLSVRDATVCLCLSGQ